MPAGGSTPASIITITVTSVAGQTKMRALVYYHGKSTRGMSPGDERQYLWEQEKHLLYHSVR